MSMLVTSVRQRRSATRVPIDVLDEGVDHLLGVADEEDEVELDALEPPQLARAQREVGAVDDVAGAGDLRDIER